MNDFSTHRDPPINQTFIMPYNFILLNNGFLSTKYILKISLNSETTY